MRLARFTHANHGDPVVVDLDLLAMWYFSQAHQATHLVSTGGAIMPVKESVDEVSRSKNQTQVKESVNATTIKQ